MGEGGVLAFGYGDAKRPFQERGCPGVGVFRDLFRGVGVLALGCSGTFSGEWVSCRWGVKGPFQGSGCPDAKVSRYLFRGEGVLALGCRGTFSG